MIAKLSTEKILKLVEFNGEAEKRHLQIHETHRTPMPGDELALTPARYEFLGEQLGLCRLVKELVVVDAGMGEWAAKVIDDAKKPDKEMFHGDPDEDKPLIPDDIPEDLVSEITFGGDDDTVEAVATPATVKAPADKPAGTRAKKRTSKKKTA